MQDFSVYFGKTKKLITPLIFITGFSIVLIIYILIMMLISGYSFDVMLYPFLSLLITGAFLAYQFFANFKMKYTKLLLSVYLLAIIVLPILYYMTMLVNRLVILTDFLLICYAATAFLTFLFTIISTRKSVLFSTKKNIVVSAISCILFLGVLGTNFYFVNEYGVFGQGKDTSAVIYERLDDGTIRANKLVGDRKSNVIINETFNGYKVSSINATLFNGANLKDATINIDYDDINIVNAAAFNNVGLRIHVKKEDTDTLRNKFYNWKYTDLGNCFVPVVSKDEIYVTFNYNSYDLKNLDYYTIPTFIGHKGDEFDLLKHSILDYVKYSNKDSIEDVYWNYLNNNKSILNLEEKKFILDENKSIDVDFEPIYYVTFEDGNDTLCKTPDTIKKIELDSDTFDFRLLTLDQINSVFESFPKRDGFDLKFYITNPDTHHNELMEGDYGSIISKYNYDNSVITPFWSIISPKVDPKSFEEGFNLTYGDKLSFTVDCEAAAKDIDLRYIIKDSSNTKVYDSNHDNSISIVGLNPTNAGSYTLIIESSSAESSLINSVSYPFDVAIQKKLIHFNWSTFADDVFDGTNKIVSVSVNQADVVGSDVISYSLKEGNQEDTALGLRDAGEYNVSLELNGESDDFYILDAENSSHKYTINKRKLTPTWNTSSLVYNGLEQTPTVTLDFPEGDTNRPEINYQGKKKNVGSYSCTFSLSNNKNYYYDNFAYGYQITPKEINVVFDNESYIYNGNVQGPKVISESGVVSGDNVAYTYKGLITNVGSSTVTAISANPNYVVSSSGKKDYSIDKLDITVTAEDKEITYGDTSYSLECSFSSAIISGNSVSGSLKANAHDVGTYDILQGTLSLGDNYNIIFVKGILTVNPKEIHVTANNITTSYGSAEQSLTYTSESLCYNDSFTGSLEREVGNNAGSYEISLGSLALSSNYTITYKKGTYKIEPKVVTIHWNDLSLEYTGVNHYSEIVAYYLDINNNQVPLKINTISLVDAGSYSVTCDFDTADSNYMLPTSHSKTYTIARALNSFNVEFYRANSTYNDSVAVTLPEAAFGTADVAYYADSTLKNEITLESNPDAGVYYALVSVEGTNNYTDLSKVYTFTVSKMNVNVIWNEPELQYNGQDHFSEIVAYFMDANNTRVDLSISVVEMIKSGEYILTIQNNLVNYNLTNPTKNYTIEGGLNSPLPSGSIMEVKYDL